MPESIQLDGYDVTDQEAQMAILNYLRDVRGQAVSMWQMLNTLCTHPLRSENRRERRFYLAQLTQLIRARKVVRYDKKYALKRGHPTYGVPKHYLGLNNKIRVSEAWA